MNLISRPVNRHDAYHAHIYFDQNSRVHARWLIEQTVSQFGLTVGRFHEKPVGPHSCWSVQVVFSASDFEHYIPWLDQHRQGLTVLVHGLTGDHLKDHTDYAYWLGEPQVLDLSIFGVDA
ncbi:MAG: DOPA 4,5-dioxygenase family protein [Oceanobacter sp.]